MDRLPASPRQSGWSLLLVAVSLAALGCGNTSASDAAIRLTVELSPQLQARCIRIWAKAQGADEQLGDPIDIGSRTSVTAAVFRSPQLAGSITLGARGFLGDGCDLPNEESDHVQATFVDGQVVPAEISLTGVPAELDVDRDGFRAASFGGVDCRDDEATVYPGAPELCTDLLDNDCNGAADCEELACSAESCNDDDSCTFDERCAQGVCTGGTTITCATPPGECFEPVGVCVSESGCTYAARTGQPCSLGFCRADGQCVDESVEADCADGLDNDNNGQTDCSDPDCATQPCDDANACTVGDTCQQAACVAGAPKVCTQSANECRVEMGSCLPNGDCEFAAKDLNVPCSLGECRAGGVCGTSETGTACANGMDDDADGLADCADPSCLASTCDDGSVCTMGETCAANGTCGGGTPLMCNTPSACESIPTGGATCDPNSGCQYDVTVGAACTGGFCDASGACVPPYPYAPQNFDPLDYPPAMRGGSYTLNCGVSTFNSSPNASSPFGNWCGQTPPPIFSLTLSNGVDVVVLPMEALTVASGAGLRLRGSRPVILAIYGAATINGVINAGSEGTVVGAGGNASTCGSNTGGQGTGTSSGGGGGAFGSAGASGGGGSGGSTGGSGGAVNGGPSLSPLRGGCGGGAGRGSNPGAGGHGGGAVQVSAASSLTINGRVTAQGGGGRGGVQNASGGGGGGSGGAVLLEGNTVTFGSSAILSTAGGGGGEGSGNSNNGDHGNDGSVSASAAAPGGSGLSGSGGDGGDGAFVPLATYPAMPGDTGSNGGGGGGGGLGRIRVNATSCTGSSAADLWGNVSISTACP